MINRNAVRLAACAVALGSLSSLSLRSSAQGAPFTIRRPPDGATVREKVKIEIPRASIGDQSFVVMYLDGKFDVALDPNRLQESSVSGSATAEKKPEDRFFTFVWDTKAEGVSDGQHSVRAVLFDPAPGGVAGISVTQRATSEVKINVANKITDGPSTLRLRYKFPEGKDLEYGRNSRIVRLGGGVLTGINSDQQVDASNSKLIFGIMNNGSDGLSLVRNKMTSLAILTSGQEVSFPENQLSKSMYQELDSWGNVHYETGAETGIEFTVQGLPVDTTIEVPVLPKASVAIGQTWTSPEQRIDIPGLPPLLQPNVKFQNKLVDLEWENNYRTAKIHQHADDVHLPSTLSVNGVPIMSPTATYDRDIYIAYTSGTLIRMVRTLTIKGRTTTQAPDDMQAGGSNGGGSPYSGGILGNGGNRPPNGVPGSFGGPPMSGGPGRSFGPPGGPPGIGGPMSADGGSGVGPGPTGGGPRRPPGGGGGGGLIPGGGGGFNRGNGVFNGGVQGQSDYPITLKASTDTTLLKIHSS